MLVEFIKKTFVLGSDRINQVKFVKTFKCEKSVLLVNFCQINKSDIQVHSGVRVDENTCWLLNAETLLC